MAGLDKETQLEQLRRGHAELAAALPFGTPMSPSSVIKQDRRVQKPAAPSAPGDADGELAWLSGAELAHKIARREVSAEQATRDALERIERIDKRLGCYVLVAADRAIDDARRLDKEKPRGPLHGVPLALKDIFDTAGIETASGSKVFRGNVPTQDGHVVARLREAGTVLLGKLNMHEVAFGLTTNNPHYGPTRNPWNTEHVPGGSSGGSSAGLAAGLCHLSLGTDTGGSIRLPAGACSIVGLKPTFGRVSRRGVLPLSWSLDHVGPMTRTVEDAALVLDVIAGRDPGDPWSSADPTESYAAALPGDIRGLRLGVPTDLFFEGLEPSLEKTVRAAIDVLVGLGGELVDVPLPHLKYSYSALMGLLGGESRSVHDGAMRERPQDFGDDVRLRLELAESLTGTQYANARRMQWLIREDFRLAFERADVLVAPTLPFTAPKIGQAVSRDPKLAWNRFMVPHNLAGLPALSVPCGFADDGLPVGLQIAGRPFDEATVLNVGYAYERATDWNTRRPPGV